MKRFIPMLFITVFFSQLAYADILVSLKDGRASVWESYYQKGDSYCTQKDIGEVCWEKVDVASIKEVPPGTKASEYEMSISEGADPEVVSQRRDENTVALKSLNCTQLKAAGTDRSQAQYRQDCYTPEQKKEWNEKVERDRDRKLRAIQAWQANSRNFQRDMKDQERDQKIDRIDRTLRGY